jgi:hypothetical protein
MYRWGCRLLAFVIFLVELPWAGNSLPTKGQAVYELVGFRVGFYFVYVVVLF